MEIVRINDKKLKITLSDADMKRHGIETSALDGESEQTHSAISRLLCEARGSVGFPASARTLVEAFPGRHGGCEIFVILLDAKRTPVARATLFYFAEKDALLRAARALTRRHGDAIESALYRLPAGGHVLALFLPEEKDGLSPYSFLSEYGERRRGALFDAYIKEYGEVLYEEGALAALCKEA